MDATIVRKLLGEGNARFVANDANTSNIGALRRMQPAERGQWPFAVVVACSDSRVVPEHLFDCGLGDIFTIRTAGNTIAEDELASVVYACAHLHCRLVVVLGHTQCGAVAAALAGGAEGAVSVLTERITRAIGAQTDPQAASVLNVQAGLDALAAHPEVAALVQEGLQLQGALHHIDTGQVEFLG